MKSNSFFLNVTALIGSNVVSQVLAVLASVIEARLYSPMEMGIYSTYIAILAVLSVIVCFQYERAIILTKDEQEAKDLIVLCVFLAAVLGIVVFLIVFLFSDCIALWFNITQLALWIKLLPLSFLVSGILLVMTYWNIKNTNMQLIAIINVITVIVMNAFQIGLGTGAFHLEGGMIIGHLIGNFTAVVLYIKKAGADLLPIHCKLNRRLLFRFKKFPVYSVPSTFFDTFAANSPNLLLANYFGAVITGYYALGYRMLSVPVSVISGAVGQAFLPKAVVANKSNTLGDTTKTVFEYVLKIALIPLVLVSLCAKPLLSVIFGVVWEPVAEYIPWLCFLLFLGLMYSPISGILIVLERQKDALIINVLTFVVKVAALCLGGVYGSALLAIASSSVTGGLVMLAACFYIMHLVKVAFSDVIKLIVKYVVRTIVFVCPMIIAVLCGSSYIIQLIVSFLNGCLFLAVSGKELISLLRRS